MAWLGKLFGKGGKGDSEAIRSLNHPADLDKGDIIKLSFLDQQDLSNKRFEVDDVNTYDFKGEQSTSFTLKGESDECVFLSVRRNNGKEYLAFSRLMKRSEVLELFDEQDFASVFDEGANTRLKRRAIPAGFEDWTASEYVEEEDCSKGYYHEGDYRNRSLPRFEDESCSLEYYLLEDPHGDFAIEIEVYESGETEVSAIAYLDMPGIEELWPAR